MTPIRSVLLASAALVWPLVRCHIELKFPPPLRSQFGPTFDQQSQDPFSMTSPLNQDGSNFPCKGFTSDFPTTATVTTLKAGSTLPVTFAGTATHNGGSCQFSVSYDGGKNFAVIHSIEGGCPIPLKYDVPIPDDLPSTDKALFAWTWFNHEGNREMYMNCAVVGVTGQSKSSFSAPGIFKANIFGATNCNTKEGEDYVFPNPGDSVQFGGSLTSSSKPTVLSPCDVNESTTITISADGKTVTNSDGTGGSGSGSTTIQGSGTTTGKPTGTQTGDADPTTTGGPSTDECSADDVQCASQTTYSLCDNGTFGDPVAVPSGYICKGNALRVSTNGSCRGGNSFVTKVPAAQRRMRRSLPFHRRAGARSQHGRRW